MTDVFISYKREQRPQCARIAEKLRALGLDVWFDANLESGRSFDTEIEERIHAAKAILVLWSPEAAQSNWVRNEATIALQRNVLVSVEIAPSKRPIQFTNTHTEPLHAADFADDDPTWRRVLARIGRLTGRRDLAALAEVEPLAPSLATPAKTNRGWMIGIGVAALVAGLGVAAMFVMRPGSQAPGPGETQTAEAPSAPPPAAAPPADVCAQARADWEQLASSQSADLIAQFIAATPQACTLQLGLAKARAEALAGMQQESARKAAAAARVDAAFTGAWTSAEGRGGPCGAMPWRFARDGDGFARTSAGGDKELFVIAGADPPTLRYPATGMRIEARKGELVVIPADGGERCYLRRA